MENNRQNIALPFFPEYQHLWKLLFFSVLAGYCLCYAPFGINETDGGFLTGLAWQVCSGKVLYGDVLYVRPPLPVWLRAAELQMLPEHWTVLGERWIFYAKVGLYSWLGAAVPAKGAHRWMTATFGFVVSVHCYPPMAWHTVDGILFSVLGIWCLAKIPSHWGAAAAGVSIFAALLCKQSFYPMAVVFIGLLYIHSIRPAASNRRTDESASPNFRKGALGVVTFVLCSALFFSYLYSNGLLENYLRLTGGAASGGQALQHGLLDYFRIKPVLAMGSILLLLSVTRYFWKGTNQTSAAWCWGLWLVFLTGSYAYDVWSHQSFTVPFAQSRLLFWVGLVYCIIRASFVIRHSSLTPHSSLIIHHSSLLAVSWCASVSWGYNVPLLFATPWVFAVLDISSRLIFEKVETFGKFDFVKTIPVAGLFVLLLTFRLGYEFVYRDGRRSDMHTQLGAVFPALGGIYSTDEKGRLYRDLKGLAARYPVFKTLPAFTQAHFLTKTRPPLPLDWVVDRETNGNNTLILKNLIENRPVLFIEKTWAGKIQTDPELHLTRDLLRTGAILDETAYFWVVRPELMVDDE